MKGKITLTEKEIKELIAYWAKERGWNVTEFYRIEAGGVMGSKSLDQILFLYAEVEEIEDDDDCSLEAAIDTGRTADPLDPEIEPWVRAAVVTFRRSGMAKDTIIERTWGIKKGGSEKYKIAKEKLDQILSDAGIS